MLGLVLIVRSRSPRFPRQRSKDLLLRGARADDGQHPSYGGLVAMADQVQQLFEENPVVFEILGAFFRRLRLIGQVVTGVPVVV